MDQQALQSLGEVFSDEAVCDATSSTVAVEIVDPSGYSGGGADHLDEVGKLVAILSRPGRPGA
jgi:hypothetical protein